MTVNPKYLKAAGTTLFMIAFFNFAAFWIIAVHIGGDALNGKIVGNHYYVSSHGHLTEVSPQVWNYSRIHAISVWITHPLGLFVGGALLVYADRASKNKNAKA